MSGLSFKGPSILGKEMTLQKVCLIDNQFLDVSRGDHIIILNSNITRLREIDCYGAERQKKGSER